MDDVNSGNGVDFQSEASAAADLGPCDGAIQLATGETAQREQPGAEDPGARSAATEIAARTAAGDLRDFVLEEIRQLGSPWRKLSESHQGYIAQRVQDRCQQIVTEAVNLIAARDFTAIAVSLEQVALKPKGIEAKLALAAVTHEIRHALVDAQGHTVMIVVADPKQFLGARGPAKIDRQALFDAPPVGEDAPGEGVGPLFVQAVGDEAAELSEDAPPVITIEQMDAARELGAKAGEAGFDRSANPYPAATTLHNQWLAGWIAPRPDEEEAGEKKPRRGRRRAPQPNDEATAP